MALERELKLALAASDVPAVTACLVELTGMPGQPLQLINRYFDTPTLALSGKRCALRLRHTPDGWLQTFKAGGNARGGLHSRHEWELPVAGEALELDALFAACGAHPAAAALKAAAKNLTPLFQTDFVRTLWQIETVDAQIEAALDQGEVSTDIAGVLRRVPILELELELKRGPEAALHLLAAQLTARVPGLMPDNISKAERGYRLRSAPRQATLFDDVTSPMRQAAVSDKVASAPLVESGWLARQFGALPSVWATLLEPFLNSPRYGQLCAFIDSERAAGKTLYPADVFRALRLIQPDDVKVVILGQDPYHGEDRGLPQAHGLAFSVPPPVRPPPSLRNIFKEISADFGYPTPTHGCLDYWAQQGVLLLNTVLTVEQGRAASHAKHGWETCTDTLLGELSARRDGLVFLLWGAHAQAKRGLLDARRHLILEAPHPSPLSAHRGFFGCHHFTLVNQHLQAHQLPPIDWRLPDLPAVA